MGIEPRNYTRSEVESILNEYNVDMVGFLEDLQKRGYLLHGSPDGNIKVFEPRVPGDLRGGWTTQKGVYATSKDKPIFFAVIDRTKAGKDSYTEAGILDGDPYYSVSQNVKDANAIGVGWIYIFDRKGFIENPDNAGEWMNPKQVKPLGKIPVKVEDLDAPIRTIRPPDAATDWSNYSPQFLD